MLTKKGTLVGGEKCWLEDRKNILKHLVKSLISKNPQEAPMLVKALQRSYIFLSKHWNHLD